MHLAGTHDDGFTASRARFEELITFLDGGQARVLDHGDLEKHLDTQGRELMRLLYQDHLELRAARERRLAHVIDAAGVDRPAAEAGHARALGTIFGQVQVE